MFSDLPVARQKGSLTLSLTAAHRLNVWYKYSIQHQNVFGITNTKVEGQIRLWALGCTFSPFFSSSYFLHTFSMQAAVSSKTVSLKIFNKKKYIYTQTLVPVGPRCVPSSSIELPWKETGIGLTFLLTSRIITSSFVKLDVGQSGQWELAPVVILHSGFCREVSLGFQAKWIPSFGLTKKCSFSSVAFAHGRGCEGAVHACGVCAQ